MGDPKMPTGAIKNPEKIDPKTLEAGSEAESEVNYIAAGKKVETLKDLDFSIAEIGDKWENSKEKTEELLMAFGKTKEIAVAVEDDSLIPTLNKIIFALIDYHKALSEDSDEKAEKFEKARTALDSFTKGERLMDEEAEKI